MYKKTLFLLLLAGYTYTGIISYAGNFVVGTVKTAAWGGCTALAIGGTIGAYTLAENYDKAVAQGAESLATAIQKTDNSQNFARVLWKLGPQGVAKIIDVIHGGKKVCYMAAGVLALASVYTASKTLKSAFRTIIPK